MIELEAWQLELPALDPNSPVHSLLPVIAPSAAPTPALDCTAHEIGRILLQAPDRVPSAAAVRFISARCNAVVPGPSIQSWVLQLDRTVSDAAMIAQLKVQLGKRPKLEAAEVGAAIVRDEKKALVVINYATPQLSVGIGKVLIGSDSTFRLTGRVLFDTDGVAAYVNAGDSSVVRCELDPAVALPEFSATCPVAAADDSAWAQVAALRRGRVISDEVFQAILLRRPDVATVYRPKRAGDAQPVSDSAAFSNDVLTSLNALRQRIGLRAVTLAHSQSQLASQVTPSLFAAIEQKDSRMDGAIDLLALGLMAGWDVDGGTIRTGQFVLNLSIDSRDSARWLANMLELPIGRAVLLDPGAHALAIGAAIQNQPAAIAAIALTYAFFEPESSPGARALQIADRLARIRRARNLGATQLISDTPGLQEQLAKIQRGEVAPEGALDTLMHRVVDAVGRNVQGLIWDTQDLDAIEFPEALLRKGDLTIAVGVTYYRAPEAAWGQYCVLFVVIENPAQPLEA